MNEFRQALDAHIAGQLEFHNLEHALNLGLTRQPQLAAAHGAYIEALYRGGRLPGETYLKLIQTIRTFQQSMPQAVATAAKPPAAPSEDKTQFRGPGRSATPPAAAPDANPDRTQFRAPRAAAPPVQPPPAAPAPDPRTPTGTGGATGTGSKSTSSSWNDPSRWGAEGEPLAPGSVIKERFVLEAELGRGGMGIVFKARDLRKEEAQDRNPFVAIKILNEEFKRHPESLKALQRESRKAQHLAHPNVVTVYDFDRDGANVYMVMELLEGESLDRLIRQAEETGVGLKKALLLTRDLCRAMAYAHEQGVVHSDFKPANAFLTRDGAVKVFDFGIARAAKRSDNVSGSTTLFDPGTLGALTPTYASCEMIEGLEPDPRDDVYAIACVAYELLTGKHPFNRMSAVQARDKGMVPKRPRGLRGYQWRALRRGLAFNRVERSASALQLLNELIPQKRTSALPIGIAATVVAAAVIGWTVVPNLLAKRRERALLDTLAAGDASRLDAVRRELQSLTPQQRAALLLDERARAGLVHFFEARINEATDASRAPVDYPRARALLNELEGFLPDSLAVRDLEDRLLARENDEIKRQSDLFDDYLRRGLLIDAQGRPNIASVIAAIGRIDSENRLLRDPRLPGAYAEQTRKALAAGDASLAQALVAAGLTFDPRDPQLQDLRDQVQGAATQLQLAARRQALEGSLRTALGEQPGLADFDRQRAAIEELRSVAAGSALLAHLQELAQRQVGQQSATLVKQGDPAQALELVARYADLLSPGFVDQQRRELASARGMLEKQKTAVAGIKSGIDTLLQSPQADADWSGRFDHQLRLLSAYVPTSDPYFVQVKDRAAASYLERARALRGAERLTEAARVLQQARVYAPQLADLSAEEKLLAEARTTQESALKERNRLAQLDALKQKLVIQARANDVNEALASFKQLRENLPANDGYLAVQAPEAIGGAYLRLASNAAKDGRFDNATSLLSRAREVAPGLAAIGPAAERYARYQALDSSLKTAPVIDVAAIRAELERLARLDPVETAAVKARLAQDLVSRIRSTADPAAAARLTSAANGIFSGDAALKILTESKSHSPAPAETSAPSQPTASQAVPDQPADTDTQSPAAAAGAATPAPRAGTSTSARVAAVRAAPVPGEAASVPRVAPEIPCEARLAGYGKRRQAVCYDTFDGGGRGPDLVVIPAGGAIARPFAVGRTELSNADYAVYCTRTGSCKPPAGPGVNPVTGISLDEAQHYLAWLSRVTGATYRLPTDAEWTYAAKGQGTAADTSSINCVIEIGGKKVRGIALEPVQSGSSNGWGMYNVFGNAQEWTVTGGTVAAHGGAFSDNVSQCSADSSRPQSGAADEATGLRAVRELE